MKLLSSLSNFIKFISLGKYRTPLYFKNKDNYSTLFSGIVTILIVSFLITYAVYVAIDVFSYNHQNFDV